MTNASNTPFNKIINFLQWVYFFKIDTLKGGGKSKTKWLFKNWTNHKSTLIL